MSKLGLSNLPAYEPITSFLDDQEWTEVFEAIGRGVPIKDILAKVGRYKTIRSFYRAIDNRRQKEKRKLYYQKGT